VTNIQAIRAYLATLAPVRNGHAAATALAAELSRRDARLELAVLKPGILMPDQQKSAHGIADAIWSKAPAIAAPATPQKHLWRRQEWPGFSAAGWSGGMFRTKARQRRTQRLEIMERGRRRRIFADGRTAAAMPAN